MAHITIAGGSGFIGSILSQALSEQGHSVRVLTRKPSASNHVFWNPNNRQIDYTAISQTEVLINLCGENIFNGKWTTKRKQELTASRVKTTDFLFHSFENSTTLKHYVSASGTDCYPLSEFKAKEEDAYSDNFIGQLVKDWEQSADQFKTIDKVKVTKMRIAMVLSNNSEAFTSLISLAKKKSLSALGTGTQPMNWVHISDLMGAFLHVIKAQVDGAFNVCAESLSNSEFNAQINTKLGTKPFFKHVPAWILKLILGDRSMLLLSGTPADNSKIVSTEFHFKYPQLQQALDQLLD
jgi:uncharacterized protein (TIGR01777 family)